LKSFCPQKESSLLKDFHYQQKFKKLFSFLLKNRKFPDFKPFTENDEKWNLFTKKFDIGKSSWNNSYEENLIKVEKMRKQIKVGKEETKMVLEYLEKALEYQAENLVFPTKATWFNDNSQRIFNHLKKSSTNIAQYLKEYKVNNN
jgi:uncharacterized protein (DUF342 family)